ncbi:MAG: FkbM family methyltransferase [Lachnospiraceae bacterium]|nr:FkbM family methyltransferase [Lachnospiraceae bacterium]
MLKIGSIKESLCDEESRILFDAKIDYMITRDERQFYEVIDKLDKHWYCQELNEALERADVKGIIIFGCGHDGRRTKKILELCNHAPRYFCDSDTEKVGKIVEGLEVVSLDDILERFRDYLIVLGSAKYAEEMYHMLVSRKFPKDRILYSKYKMLVAECGKQYFDIFSAGENEVFVDGGGFNGDTFFDFVTWTKGEYKKIYVFEPNAEMAQEIKKRIKNEKISGVELYQNALWNKKESLSFLESGAGSCILNTGTATTEGVSLDEIVKDEKVSYIKMDVEGSELKALQGAKETIKNNKPKLAICIYHKPEDILDLLTYILELVPEYKLSIRHYTSCMWETVLYAEVFC